MDDFASVALAPSDGLSSAQPLDDQRKSPGASWLLLTLGLCGAAAGSFSAAAVAGGGVAALLGGVQLLGALVLGGAFCCCGRSRLTERALRLAYADALGADSDAHEGDRLRQALCARRRVLPVCGYRDAPDDDWQALALDPRVEDLPFLKTALRLSSVEERRTRRAARARLKATHRALWRRLCMLDPGLLLVVQNL